MKTYDFYGKHLMAEYYQVDFETHAQVEKVKTVLLEALKCAEMTCIDMICETFEPMGYTIVAALLESHASIHAYPEHRAMFVDVFTCGSKKPHSVHECLMERLNVKQYKMQIIDRGNDSLHSQA